MAIFIMAAWVWPVKSDISRLILKEHQRPQEIAALSNYLQALRAFKLFYQIFGIDILKSPQKILKNFMNSGRREINFLISKPLKKFLMIWEMHSASCLPMW